jgi:hypothetical protein
MCGPTDCLGMKIEGGRLRDQMRKFWARPTARALVPRRAFYRLSTLERPAARTCCTAAVISRRSGMRWRGSRRIA